MSPVNLELSVFQVLLFLLNSGDEGQILVLKILEFLVQVLRISEKQAIVVIIVRQLHQVQVHQLIESLQQPGVRHSLPGNLALACAGFRVIGPRD